MAKIALLIGVSEYQPGLNPLAGAIKDVEAMQRVLQHPEMGGFAESDITVLKNPRKGEMEKAIEKLFSNRSKEDLLLLYFAGHGINNLSNNKFYLTNRETEQDIQKMLVKSTATESTWIQNRMEESRSRRQIVILDCCFSGAFAGGMTVRSAVSCIDIKSQLGGEGRAVLASSSATEYTQEESSGGVYTRYIVEGIETGAADTDNDGAISVDELHEYVRKQLQEAAPAMKPEIYAIKEGFKIKLAKAPIGDPKLKYRKEVGKYLREGEISTVGNRILKSYQNELGLSDGEVKQIQDEVLEPYRIYQANLKEYEEAVQEALQHEATLSQLTQNELKHFQQLLQLRDEDVEPINRKLISFSSHFDEEVKETENQSSQEKQTSSILENTTISSSEDDLSSEKDINYTRLRDLLKAGNWKEADYETYLVMFKAVGREKGDWIGGEEVLNFPCTDLRTIDKLWVKYSNGQFGFSVQKEIYLSVGGIADGKYYKEAWTKFVEKVKFDTNTYKLILGSSPQQGHLPNLPFFFQSLAGVMWGDDLFSRIETCKL